MRLPVCRRRIVNLLDPDSAGGMWRGEKGRSSSRLMTRRRQGSLCCSDRHEALRAVNDLMVDVVFGAAGEASLLKNV